MYRELLKLRKLNEDLGGFGGIQNFGNDGRSIFPGKANLGLASLAVLSVRRLWAFEPEPIPKLYPKWQPLCLCEQFITRGSTLEI